MQTEVQIVGIEIYKSNIELKEPFRIAIMEIKTAASLFLKVKASNGLYGLGEANPTSGITGETQASDLAAAVECARFLLHRNPLDIENRTRELRRFLACNSTLRSAFDMALYDLLGKTAGLPLYALLGGGKRTFWTDNTIGLAEPEKMAARALEYKDKGFHAIKVKLGTTQEKDHLRIQRIREKIGDDLPIRIDANQGWNYPTAVATLRALETFGIEYCEQPVPARDLENLRRVRDHCSIPIMADESLFTTSDAFRLAVMGCCDFFNIKLAKAGGIHEALKIEAVAESAGIPCMMGCMTETRLGLTAAAHLISARSNFIYADLDGYLMLQQDPIVDGAIYNVGEITLPDKPGIGADLDPAFLATCEKITLP